MLLLGSSGVLLLLPITALYFLRCGLEYHTAPRRDAGGHGPTLAKLRRGQRELSSVCCQRVLHHRAASDIGGSEDVLHHFPIVGRISSSKARRRIMQPPSANGSHNHIAALPV